MTPFIWILSTLVFFGVYNIALLAKNPSWREYPELFVPVNVGIFLGGLVLIIIIAEGH